MDKVTYNMIKKMIDSNRYLGIMRGIVEFNRDPLKIGRCKVRIPYLHGDPDGSDSFMSTEGLPWSTPSFPIGGGYSHGSFIIPEVGDVVYVMFENNDPATPLYIGSSYGAGTSNPKQLGQYSLGSKTYSASNGVWNIPMRTPETPLQIHEDDTKEVTKKVIYTSPKGASIVIDDQDGNEYLELTDRAGQSIRMFSPVGFEENANNRANYSVNKDIESPESRIEITTRKGLEVEISDKLYVKNPDGSNREIVGIMDGGTF